MEDWQKTLLEKIRKNKEFGVNSIVSSSRRIGKSFISQSAFERLWNDLYNQPLTDLLLSEKTFCDAVYYCVEPVGGNWIKMSNWAVSTYGEPSTIWDAQNFMWPENGRWFMNNRIFWFRNERDRTMFILKWR